MMKKIKTWKQIVIDTLFPRFCLICNKRLGINEKDVCISCFCNMPFTHFKGEKGNVIERLTCDDIICTKRANSFFFYEKECDRLSKLHICVDDGAWKNRTYGDLYLLRVFACK